MECFLFAVFQSDVEQKYKAWNEISLSPGGLCVHRTWRLCSLRHPQTSLSVTQFLSGETRCCLANPLTSLTGTVKPRRAPQCFACDSGLLIRGNEMTEGKWGHGPPFGLSAFDLFICKRLPVSDLEVEGFFFSQTSVIKTPSVPIGWPSCGLKCPPPPSGHLYVCSWPRPALSNAAWLPLFTTTLTSSDPQELNYVPC